MVVTFKLVVMMILCAGLSFAAGTIVAAMVLH